MIDFFSYQFRNETIMNIFKWIGEGQGGINATRCTSAVVKVKKASMLQDVPVQCSGDLDYIFHHIKICLSLYNTCIKTLL